MKEQIPTYSIDEVKRHGDLANKEVFFSEKRLDALRDTLNKPYRSSYYGLAICLSGKATLTANLETYEIQKNDLIAMSPQVIKKWSSISKDYETITVFFTADFFVKYAFNQQTIDQFSFFDVNAKHVNSIQPNELAILLTIFFSLKKSSEEIHPYQNEILASYIKVLLFEYQNIFGKLDFNRNFQLTRSQQLTNDFKKLVHLNFQKERSVKFYAEQLFVSSKHLSEIIKQETGKTAGESIDELLLLEAKVLLISPQLQIAQIAEILHFSDPSTFGKFFKNLEGLSPVQYRQSL